MTLSGPSWLVLYTSCCFSNLSLNLATPIWPLGQCIIMPGCGLAPCLCLASSNVSYLINHFCLFGGCLMCQPWQALGAVWNWHGLGNMAGIQREEAVGPMHPFDPSLPKFASYWVSYCNRALYSLLPMHRLRYWYTMSHMGNSLGIPNSKQQIQGCLYPFDQGLPVTLYFHSSVIQHPNFCKCSNLDYSCIVLLFHC